MTSEKNLCILCSTNCFKKVSFSVVVKDSESNTIIDCRQLQDKYINYHLQKEGTYKIIITPDEIMSPSSAYRWVKIDKCRKSTQLFIFSRICYSPRYVRMNFTLKDAKYQNLPIKKGVIYLWHKALP